ncbi:MAG TPA: type IX secretion system membrane protein PorP/SprF [Cytophagaceae bacterium]|jgi:type IX secretion system PorP/SprF family membrane protein|nr:type IX secretion system membrane protein PorP/SprF [Cytophagaceae bacterium]
MNFRFYILLLLSLLPFLSNSQDAQFSQFYAAPLYLNPAFAGTTHASRAVANYRLQWPAAGKPYTSYAASFDHFFGKYKSGLGILLMQNKEGTSRYRSTEASLIYSYHIDVNETWTFIPGIQANFTSRDIDYAELTFPDQFNNSGFTGAATNENFRYQKRTYLDFSTGGLLYSDIFWFGSTYHHLNHPNQSFTNNLNRLPGEINLHAGARIPLSSMKGRSSQGHYREKAIVPAILYKAQGKFDQLDIGTYLILEPIMFGLWYRGLPFKRYAPGYPNSESIIALVGINHKDLTFGYSYDFVISSLSLRSAGAHEISVTYEFGQEKTFKKSPRQKRLPCPKFYRNF